ncbi:spore germination protein [Fictibacillus sp. 7GRE50]|uniref:spore germination protein n=1 Tax=Fictibacillus sp. 7GRE50 TaxID=2745878 RepID=UPI0018CF2703|nr:spore germination protein [Fictibacillus sp. 7GRE50]MBH0167241.1 spore germination protein [Fictibacillus sp. 7GRE50]
MFRKGNSKNHHINNNDNQETNLDSVLDSSSQLVDYLLQKCHQTSDLKILTISNLTLFFIDNQVNQSEFNLNIIGRLNNQTNYKIDDVINVISVGDIEKSSDISYALLSVLKGSVCIYTNGIQEVILIKIPSKNNRSLSKPENESQVIGSQVGFNESLSTNVSLIRRSLATPDLKNEFYIIGRRTNTGVSVLYIEGLASNDLVQRMRERLSSIDIDGLLDSAELNQLINDNSLSIFPQMLLTERPDRVCHGLLNGKITVLVDGSPMAILCPLSFIEFFESKEDYNVRWPIASFVRLLRITAVFLSVFFTALYVAALTFHYEVIPQALLVPLGESRSRVPFPPLFEAILLEFIIELLREAGARLPTKVGQTMGIVGGIVIGTAAVQAGFTSNILIIIVALGALASFTTPSYPMGSLIRVIRFPILILAGFWGFYGIMFGFCFIMIHLLRLTTLGSPYMAPFYPPRFKDWVDSIVRLPFRFIYKRQALTRPADKQKYNPDEVN